MKCGYDYSRDLGAKPFSLESAVCELPAEWRVTWDDETFSYACDSHFIIECNSNARRRMRLIQRLVNR